jgi:hypothetical protein
LKAQNDPPESLQKLLTKDFKLVLHKGWVRDTYVLKDPDLFYSMDKLIRKLNKVLKKVLSSSDLKNAQSDFFELANAIRQRNLMKITPNYDHPHQHLFSNLTNEDILNTGLSWVYMYRSALEKVDEWDLLLVISEKGRFLNQDISKVEGKKIELIISSFDTPEKFMDISKAQEEDFKKLPLLSGMPLKLPWWLHNQHMAFFLKKKPIEEGGTEENLKWTKKWKLIEGFYYQSRSLSRNINPVHVTHKKDLKTLMIIFANYWYRATVYTSTQTVPIIKDEKEMEQRIEALLDLYDNPIGKNHNL